MRRIDLPQGGFRSPANNIQQMKGGRHQAPVLGASMSNVTRLPIPSEVPETKRPAHSVPADDLTAAGKRLRDTIPRASQGMWKRPRDRRDPLEILHASDEGRM